MKVLKKFFKNSNVKREDLLDLFSKKKKLNLNGFYKTVENEFNSIYKTDEIDLNSVNNFFSFVENNIDYDDFNEIKDTINFLVNVEGDLLKKIEIVVKLNDKELSKGINDILSRISESQNTIASHYDKTYQELLYDISIEKVFYILFEKKDIKKSVKVISENPFIFDYVEENGNDFISIIFEKYKKRLFENSDKEEIKYFVDLLRYIIKNENATTKKKNISSKVAQITEFSNTNYKRFDVISSASSNIDLKLFNSKYNIETDRFQFINDYIFSLDSENTDIFDDALSIEITKNNTYLLSIHMADVISLGLNSKNVLDGVRNDKICKKDASLKSLIPKNAITLLVEITPDGEVLDYKIVKSIITLNCNMYHNDFKKFLGHEENQYMYYESIKRLCELYGVLKNTKMKDDPSLDEFAPRLVEKYMILCGSIISKHFLTNSLPFLYLNTNYNNNSVYYSNVNNGYDTGFEELGYNSYGKLTSPIYDDPSLISQLGLYNFVFNNYTDKDIYYYESKMLKMSQVMNKRNNYRIS